MAQIASAKTVSDLLRETRIRVSPATYVLVGLDHADWSRLLEETGLSPRPDSSFMIFRDDKQVTMLVEDDDWNRMRHAVRDARIESQFRLLTLDVELGWDVVGYLARVTEILASAGIAIGALSSFSRDHLVIKQEDLGKALKVLASYTAEIC